jgi:hypothetical protein
MRMGWSSSTSLLPTKLVQRARVNNAYSLTVAQKVKVLKLNDKMAPIFIAREIVKDDIIENTPEQKEDPSKFAANISRWNRNPSTKEKYMCYATVINEDSATI